ncbi:hypothetical protein AACH10_07120 [Ideonella sp. DXS22W]|uniref:Uncharacterized protein n=1 Tax=Pseudaquabacterium inlustre TaxID=2984192 RepID=A0ABU9CDP7_9BURK
MSRLHAELQRLYGLALPDGPAPGATPTPDPDPAAGQRLLVLGLSRPADWSRLQPLWQAVQDGLGLPAPAIVIDGQAGMQLWLALARPVPADQARAFVDGLRRRHLADVPDSRLTLRPGPDASAPPLTVPGGQVQPEQWSAFVAPDLAPMFSETPWLDLAPPPEGQAELLARLQPASAEVFERACATLAASLAGPVPMPGDAAQSVPAPAASGHAGAVRSPSSGAPALAAADQARQFLLVVMHDAQQPMALRIDAARALLGPPGR